MSSDVRPDEPLCIAELYDMEFEHEIEPTGITWKDMENAERILEYREQKFVCPDTGVHRYLADCELYEIFYKRKWPYGDQFHCYPHPSNPMHIQHHIYKRAYKNRHGVDPVYIFDKTKVDQPPNVHNSPPEKKLKTNDKSIVEETVSEQTSPGYQTVQKPEGKIQKRLLSESEDSNSMRRQDLNSAKDSEETESLMEEVESVNEEKIPIKEMPPNPLTVIGIENVLEFTQKMATLVEFEFEIKVFGKQLRVFTDTFANKEKLRKIFIQNRIQFYNTIERPKILKAVIRGLPINFPIDHIKHTLGDLGFRTEKITQMSSRKDGKILPLFLIQIVKEKESNKIFEVRSIFKIRVQIEQFRIPKKATQCYRCQNFFHVAANCHIDPRCAGCGLGHETRDCPKKPSTAEEKKNSLATCCNCGQNHPASYRGCTKFPTKPQFKKSFAEIVKGKNSGLKIPAKPKPPKLPEPTPKLFTEELYQLHEFASEASTLMNLIRQIKEALQITSLGEYIKAARSILTAVNGQTDKLQRTATCFSLLEKFFSTGGACNQDSEKASFSEQQNSLS